MAHFHDEVRKDPEFGFAQRVEKFSEKLAQKAVRTSGTGLECSFVCLQDTLSVCVLYRLRLRGVE